MYILLEVIILLSLHILSVLLYIHIRFFFLARDKHFNIFTSLYVHVFFSAGDDT